jgi:lipopolysaccharide export system protein LptA
MWTPKRITLLMGGFAAFFTAYQVYSAFLGGIDGLTPLPADYWPVADGTEQPMPAAPIVNLADRKLQQAFGEACEELRRNTKLEVRNRGLVLAVDEFMPVDGRVQLKPFSAAIFGKLHPGETMPEINTINADVALLQFDRPITNVTEMASRKLIGAELDGNITITNNRRTPQRDDDLVMRTRGPMYYVEDRHWIGTKAEVELTDYQSKPEKATVTAKGMDLFLTTDKGQPNSSSAARKGKVEGISGVERVVLLSTVRMDLFVDARSGFLAPSKSGAGSATPVSPSAKGKPSVGDAGAVAGSQSGQPEKSKVVITTMGPFTYDVANDHARFDIPLRAGNYPENVEVKRLHEQGKLDQLVCDHLDIHFQRKPSPGPQTGPDSRSMNLEIASAHATMDPPDPTHPRSPLTLTSDAEGLDAFGNDLFYDAQQRRSILKGPQTMAMKDGNEIISQELWMIMREDREGNEAIAKGPGHIRMLDSKGHYSIEARWTKQLEYKKEGLFDALTLTGDAVFEDKEHEQRMSADRLKVLLEPAEPGTNTDKKQQQRVRPHHLEAKGRVTADSPELRIKGPTDNLVIWFKDAPVTSELPTLADGSAPKPPTVAGGLFNFTNNPSDAPAPASNPPVGTPPAPIGEKPKKPIELNARSVVVHVSRSETKSELDQLNCEGAVHVHQEPTSPEDKGIDIRGEALQVNHYPEGSVLIVNGSPGQVQFDKLTIMGPEVNIDQRTNKAWVDGIGVMQMLTDTNFDGAKLAKPTELTIHWKEAMQFFGKNAEFHGGIQAEQQTSRLLCEEMQVSFDRPISLREGDKKGQARPKVDQLICDKSVQVEDITRVDGKLQAYKRLVAPVVSLDNEEQQVTAPGPGEVRILQLGTADQGLPGPPAQKGGAKPAASTTSSGAKPAPIQELFLTHVRFRERMQTFNKSRTAYFYGDVEVIHLPSDQPDLKIKIDPLPERCMYLKCKKLAVFSHVLPNGQRSQEMEAWGHVLVQAQEFYGLADVVKYDENLDRVIFEGVEGSPATLYRVKGRGGQQEKVSGKKIIYHRKTGEYHIEDGQGINVAN